MKRSLDVFMMILISVAVAYIVFSLDIIGFRPEQKKEIEQFVSTSMAKCSVLSLRKKHWGPANYEVFRLDCISEELPLLFQSNFELKKGDILIKKANSSSVQLIRSGHKKQNLQIRSTESLVEPLWYRAGISMTIGVFFGLLIYWILKQWLKWFRK